MYGITNLIPISIKAHTLYKKTYTVMVLNEYVGYIKILAQQFTFQSTVFKEIIINIFSLPFYSSSFSELDKSYRNFRKLEIPKGLSKVPAFIFNKALSICLTPVITKFLLVFINIMYAYYFYVAFFHFTFSLKKWFLAFQS